MEKKIVKSKVKVPEKKKKEVVTKKDAKVNGNRWYDKYLSMFLNVYDKVKKLGDKNTRIVVCGSILSILFVMSFYIPKLNDDTYVGPCKPEVRMVDEIKAEVLIQHVKPTLDPYVAIRVGESVDKWSKHYKLPKIFVLGVMWHESHFNPLATSNKNAVGLMQVYRKAHRTRLKGIPKSELYHIDTNIKYGCEILKESLDKAKGDYYKAMNRYLGLGATFKMINDYAMDVFNKMGVLMTYQETLMVQPKIEEEEREEEKKEE